MSHIAVILVRSVQESSSLAVLEKRWSNKKCCLFPTADLLHDSGLG
jgi:hypothetical protein